MSRTNIKAVIPVNTPDSMITLSEAVTTKYESYGGSTSPLDGEDMAGFKTRTEEAKALLVSADEKHASGESATMEAYTIMGFAEGQDIRTHNTLYYTMDVIRGILLAKLKDDEKQLEKYGFNVVLTKVNKKVSVRVELPINRFDKFLKLCGKITKKYESFGGSTSPLDVVDMATFKTQTLAALAKLEQARDFHEVAEGETQRAYTKIGIYKGQTSRTKDTLYYQLDVFRGILLKKFKTDEEQLEQWGFTIVITETLLHRNSKRITVIIPKNQFVTVSNIVNHSEGKNIGVTDLEWCASHTVCTPENASVLNPDEVAEINTPDGVVTIKNRSTVFSGRIRMSITN